MTNLVSSTTKSYAFFALALTAAYWGIVSLPYMASVLNQYIGIDPLVWIGSGGVLGPKKMVLLHWIALGVSGLLVAGLALTLTQPGRLSRILILLTVLPVIWVSNIWINMSMQGEYAKRIHATRLATVDYDAIFDREILRSADIKTYDDFYQAVDANYNRYSEVLRKRWNIQNEDRLKAIFYLVTTSNLFAFGDKIDRLGSGCANLNEESGGNVRNPDVLGVRYYLDTNIGCCSDYATILYFLLTEAGIENRMVALPIHGHWINEVQLDGKWQALDANIGAFYQYSWAEMVEGSNPFEVLLFPVLSFDISKSSYRPIMNMFRQKILMVAASGAEAGVAYAVPKSMLPPYQNMKPLKN